MAATWRFARYMPGARNPRLHRTRGGMALGTLRANFEIMTDVESLTVQVLREIRDDIRLLRTDLIHRIDATNARLDDTNGRLDVANTRLDHLDTTMMEMSEQQRFVVRYTRTISEREGRSEREIAELRTRMEILEARWEPPPR